MNVPSPVRRVRDWPIHEPVHVLKSALFTPLRRSMRDHFFPLACLIGGMEQKLESGLDWRPEEMGVALGQAPAPAYGPTQALPIVQLTVQFLDHKRSKTADLLY